MPPTFSQLDSNGDGAISREEFEAAKIKLQKKAVTGAPEAVAHAPISDSGPYPALSLEAAVLEQKFLQSENEGLKQELKAVKQKLEQRIERKTHQNQALEADNEKLKQELDEAKRKMHERIKQKRLRRQMEEEAKGYAKAKAKEEAEAKLEEARGDQKELVSEKQELQKAIESARARIIAKGEDKLERKSIENYALQLDNEELAMCLEKVQVLVEKREALRAKAKLGGIESVAQELQELREQRLEVQDRIYGLQPRPVRSGPGQAIDSDDDDEDEDNENQ
mmetsp:Transcript_23637/g.42767  ORF Transcript_23637/g.42767 Transcript_23637/m.42767 type:complete len:280 (+) Transcript_23637:36-875(+)